MHPREDLSEGLCEARAWADDLIDGRRAGESEAERLDAIDDKKRLDERERKCNR